MDSTLLLIATLLFAAHFGVVLASLRRGAAAPPRFAAVLLAAGFIMQNGVLWLRGNLQGRCPITSACEVLVFVAWAVMLWYFLLGPTYRLSLLGLFTSPLVAGLQAVALLPGVYQWEKAPPAAPVNPWMELHGSLSLLAYGAFGMAALAGVMYLAQDRALKRRHHGPVFFHLPPINHLFQAMMLVLTLGSLLLAAGMLAGYATPARPAGGKHVVSYVVLAVYAVVVVARWRGTGHRRVALGAVAAFVVAVASLWFLS
jgi:HemX protein